MFGCGSEGNFAYFSDIFCQFSPGKSRQVRKEEETAALEKSRPPKIPIFIFVANKVFSLFIDLEHFFHNMHFFIKQVGQEGEGE